MRFHPVAAATALALLLATAPVGLQDVAPFFGQPQALADKGGGGHDHGPDGEGHPDDPGGPAGGAGPAGNGNGHAFGRSIGAENGNGNAAPNGNAFGHTAKTDPMHPSNLGRLNGFLNASSNALASASDNSAIGALSKTYRDLLGAYLSGDDGVSIDDVAAAMANAANKDVTPEQVEAVNERLAVENPQDPNLAGLGNPTNDPDVEAQNDALAAEISDRANEIQAEENNQGLGQRIAGFLEGLF